MNSYLTHFGLNKAPFSGHVVGNSVFIAPQLATVVTALKKALSTEDAVVCLSGPVGSGKTTIAKRALENIGQNRGIVTIGRMPFGHDEVLEILLAGLGARQLPKSTVHRFATFRRLLQQFAEQHTRVFILVEDATRIGLDALSELEALTAADAGVSNGANLVLLGDDSLNDLLRDPKMARLKQRLRSRQKIEAQTESELQGYLKHCFRLAGREFETIFAEGSARAVHRLSDGLPRIANNLLEAALNAAAEKGETRIGPEMIQQVGAEEFGLTMEHSITDVAAAIEKAAAVENILPPKPEPVIAAQPAPVVVEEEEIPELIQDTLPDLEILAPELAAAPTPAAVPSAAAESRTARPSPPKVVPVAVAARTAEPVAEAVHEPTENELPVLTSVPAEARDEDGRVPTEVPAWDRDPTFAELRPDLEALERAMAIAQGPDAVAAASKRARNSNPDSAEADAVAEVIPEITLDKQIEAKIQEATEALKKTQPDANAEIRSGENASNDDTSGDQAGPKAVPRAAPKAAPKPAPKPAPQPAPRSIQKPEPKAAPKPEPTAVARPAAKPVAVASKPAAAAAVAPPAKDPVRPAHELEKIASSIARAKTIEDVDDYMAETLFGEEFSLLAAQVAANASQHADTDARDAGLSLTADEPKTPPTVDTSPSQRLKVLRELNKSSAPRGAPSTPDPAENIVISGGEPDMPTNDEPPAVDSIEDQISTSITQTLQALSIRPNPKSDIDDDDEDDDGDDSDKGFFSRFRRK